MLGEMRLQLVVSDGVWGAGAATQEVIILGRCTQLACLVISESFLGEDASCLLARTTVHARAHLFFDQVDIGLRNRLAAFMHGLLLLVTTWSAFL